VCEEIQTDLECNALQGTCQWLAGPSLEEARRHGPELYTVVPDDFQPLDIVPSETTQAAVVADESPRRVLGAQRNLVLDCTGASMSVGTVPTASIAVPGQGWSLDLAGVFTSSPPSALTVTVSAQPSALGSWVVWNATTNQLEGSPPVGIGRLGKSTVVSLAASDECLQTAVTTVTVTVNSDPVRAKQIAQVVMDVSSTDEQTIGLALESVFVDDDMDVLTFTLKQALSSPDGALSDPPAGVTLVESTTQSTALPTLPAQRAFHVHITPSPADAGTTLYLAVLASDGVSSVTPEARFSVHFVTHCQVTAFTAWTTCTKLCDGGVQNRTRTVTVDPVGDLATECPDLDEEQECNTDHCATAPTVQTNLRFVGLNLSSATDAGLADALVDELANITTVDASLITVTIQSGGVIEQAASSSGGGGARMLAGIGADAPGSIAPTLIPVVEALVNILVPSSVGTSSQLVAQSLDAAVKGGSLGSAISAILNAAGFASVQVTIASVSVSSQRVVANERPLPRNRVVVVSRSRLDTVLELDGIDLDGQPLTTFVFAQPSATSGRLFQLSQVFSDFGYEPIAGVELTGLSPSNASLVTGSRSRVAFKAERDTPEPDGAYGFVTHLVGDGITYSVPGLTWLVPEHRRLLQARFNVNASGWSIRDNSDKELLKPSGGILHETYVDGELDRYVMGIEAMINPNSAGLDRAQWAFEAPSSFGGNLAGAYGGALEFTLGIFEGAFEGSDPFELRVPLVELLCASCGGRNGVRLGHYATLAELAPIITAPAVVRIPLVASQWQRKPDTITEAWKPVSECELLTVLSGLTGLRIRGDLTPDHEAVALDSVGFVSADSSDVSADPTVNVIRSRVERDGLPLDCRFALTGDIATGGTNAVQLTLA
jgi:hypothetical protein